MVEAALAPPGEPETEGLTGWVIWSLGEWVARCVAAQPGELHRGLQCLHALTQRFSAEFAIRPLLRDHPAEVWPVIGHWAEDPIPAVWRLALSEGSCLRLPWGLRLQALVRIVAGVSGPAAFAGRPGRRRAPQRGQPPE